MNRPVICATLVLLTYAVPSQAGLIITVSQSGRNVVAVGAGSVNTAALTVTTESGPGEIIPKDGLLAINQDHDVAYVGIGISGPSSFGPGGQTVGSSATGPASGIVWMENRIILPFGYASGAPISDTQTWDNTTISALGAIPGTYIWTWGSGPTADSLKLVIGAVPEPSSLILAGTAIGVVGFGAWIRRRVPGRVAPGDYSPRAPTRLRRRPHPSSMADT
jgi:hypothetical protein